MLKLLLLKDVFYFDIRAVIAIVFALRLVKTKLYVLVAHYCFESGKVTKVLFELFECQS